MRRWVAPALEATWLGPWSAGSALLLLARESTREAEARGGPAAIVRALESAARAAGVELRCSARVSQIAIDADCTKGVVLEDGETVDGMSVLSTLDPETTLLDVLPRASRSSAVARAMRGWRARGTSAKLHLALDGPLELSAGGLGGAVEHATTGESLGRARTGFRCRQVPPDERATDSRSARAESFRSQFGPRRSTRGLGAGALSPPFDLEGGWTEEARDQLQTRVLDEIEILAPGTRARVLACELLTPSDLAQTYGMQGGHLHQGETAMDQFLLAAPGRRIGTPRDARARPLPGRSRHASGRRSDGHAGLAGGGTPAANGVKRSRPRA